jgi:DNA-binding transcriptional MerR regulator
MSRHLRVTVAGGIVNRAQPRAMTPTPLPDPLQALRAYRGLAPWNLRDLSLLVGALLEASSVTPINAAARARPSERTIRFYVSRGLVSPPDGRGTAATYTYRHFLQLLCVKVRQMEGATLDAITQEMKELTGDVLERRAAHALGAALPAPDRLALRGAGGLPRGRSGRALSGWLVRDASKDVHGASTWRRIPVARGVELHVDADHPLARVGPLEADVAESVRQALTKLLPTAPA